MKIWQGYGSEHSMNLVMIGYFKSSEDAENVHTLFDQLTDGLRDKIDVGASSDRYSEEVLSFLRELNCYSLSAFELEQFLYDISISVDGDKIVLTTEESEVSAFLKLMVLKGAKVEVFSGHDYPEADYGRGK